MNSDEKFVKSEILTNRLIQANWSILARRSESRRDCFTRLSITATRCFLFLLLVFIVSTKAKQVCEWIEWKTRKKTRFSFICSSPSKKKVWRYKKKKSRPINEIACSQFDRQCDRVLINSINEQVFLDFFLLIAMCNRMFVDSKRKNSLMCLDSTDTSFFLVGKRNRENNTKKR